MFFVCKKSGIYYGLLLFTVCIQLNIFFMNKVNSQEEEMIPEVVVTGTPIESTQSDIPYNVNTVNIDLSFGGTNGVDFIPSGNGIWHQSKYYRTGTWIRGVKGDRLGILLDGIKINDSLTSNVGGSGRRIDTPFGNYELTSIQAVRGPSSITYGSDAMAGVVNFITVNKYKPDEFITKIFSSVNTNSNAYGGGMETHIPLSSGMWSEIHYERYIAGNSKAGKWRGELENTAWNSYSGYIRVGYNNEKYDIKLTARDFHEGDILRYDTPDKWYDNELQRYVFSFQTKANPIIYTLKLFYDDRDDKQWQTKTKKGKTTVTLSNNLNSRIGITAIASGNISLNSDLIGGVELSFEDPKSAVSKTEYDTTITKSDDLPEFPKSDYDTKAVYLQYRHKVMNNKLVLLAGTRYDRYEVTSHPNSSEIPTGLTYDDLKISKRFSELTFSAGTRYIADKELSFNLSIEKGFNAPAVTHFTEARVGSKQAWVPNPDIKPETSMTYQFGTNFKKYRTNTELVCFYTKYNDMITKKSATYLGQDKINGVPIYRRENVSDAFIGGIELSMDIDVGKGFLGYLRTNYTGARDLDTDESIDIPPVSAEYGIKWIKDSSSKMFWVDLKLLSARQVSSFNSDTIDSLYPDLPISTLGNYPDPSIDGYKDISNRTLRIPGYTVTDLMLGYQRKNFTFKMGINNIFDKLYQPFKNAPAPGRSFFVSNELTF